MDNEKIKKILGLSNSKLIVDLYGTCKGIENYDYCLSTRILDYQIIKSFALEMRPIEMNVYNNVSGEGIYLYDIKKVSKAKRRNRIKQSYRIYKYYYPFLQYYKTLAYMLYETKNKIKEKFSNES